MNKPLKPQYPQDKHPDRASGNIPVCPHCRPEWKWGPRHYEYECWTLHPEQRPPSRKGRTKYSQNQSQQHKGVINSIKSPTHPVWTLDSACSKHCTGNREVFTTYKSIKGQKPKLDLPDGQSATVSGIGTITFDFDGNNKLHVKNVRHIPKIRFNLLSPDQLIKDGWDIDLIKPSYAFRLVNPDGDTCEAQRDRTQGVWNITQPAYPTEAGPDHLIASIQQPASDSHSMPIEAWHLRLNHLNQGDLQHMHRVGAITISGPKTLPNCDFCFKAKMKRTSGQSSPQRVTKPFSKLHIDIAGGGNTLGPPEDGLKYRYFIIVVDDATRLRSVYFIEDRTRVSSTLLFHLKHLKNQGLGSPASLRFDNEFMTREIADYLEQEGIQAEPTAPDSPWMNGVSERSIGIMMQRTRATLKAANLPARFFPEALEDTVFKSNFSSTSVPLYNDSKGRAPGDGEDHAQQSKFSIPVDAWQNRHISNAYLHQFGAPVWYHLHGARAPNTKLDNKGKKGILIS